VNEIVTRVAQMVSTRQQCMLECMAGRYQAITVDGVNVTDAFIDQLVYEIACGQESLLALRNVARLSV
jgi:hypothetical protein